MRSKKYNQAKSLKQRFATRKLKVGLVSVLLGFTMVFGNVGMPSLNHSNAYVVQAAYARGIPAEYAISDLGGYGIGE